MDLSKGLLENINSKPLSPPKIENEEIQSENKDSNYFVKEGMQYSSDHFYEFGSLVKAEEEIYSLQNFVREFKTQVKNVDNFYITQLKLNSEKFEKISSGIKNRNQSSVISLIFIFY